MSAPMQTASRSPEDPIARAIAQIEAMNREAEALRQRIAADPRCRYLTGQLTLLRSPEPRAGNDGRDDVFASMLSPDRYRKARLRRLLLARQAQLTPERKSTVATLLMEAAVYRRSEPPVLTILREETEIGIIARVVADSNVHPAFRAALREAVNG